MSKNSKPYLRRSLPASISNACQTHCRMHIQKCSKSYEQFISFVRECTNNIFIQSGFRERIRKYVEYFFRNHIQTHCQTHCKMHIQKCSPGYEQFVSFIRIHANDIYMPSGYRERILKSVEYYFTKITFAPHGLPGYIWQSNHCLCQKPSTILLREPDSNDR